MNSDETSVAQEVEPTTTVHVTTFYSYKGGVGRSLLLANVGWLLAEHRRVLLWDLDIEAPGLDRIPALRPPEVQKGFLEWLGSWEWDTTLTEGGSLGRVDAEALRRLVLRVPGRPNLSILPAFGDRADVARIYAAEPWRRWVVDEPTRGLRFFDAVLAVLGQDRDHILIDSRTGITDVGGFLAALLPHATVMVGSYGHQSLSGLQQVRTALEADGRLALRQRLDPGASLKLLHVISPVPEAVDQSAERRRVWLEVFGDLRPTVVPFDRRLLWSEDLLAATDPKGDTARAYTQVADRLTSLREELATARGQVNATVARSSPPSKGAEERDVRSEDRRGLAFEERVKRLLELHGYLVEPKQILGGREVDLVARRTGGLEQELWWVECKDHQRPVGTDVLEKLALWVAGKEGQGVGARGMVVAKSFTSTAVTFAADQSSLKVWTVDDLERRLFDPRPYLQSLINTFEQGPLLRTYVRQRVRLESRPADEATVDLLSHALAWSKGQGTRLWLLLGDYGTGKTAFFQRFAYELARRALDNSEEPFPLAIDLKDHASATATDTILFEHLRRMAPTFRGDPAALRHLLATGRCLMLIDTFDEMGLVAAGHNVEDQFRELARLAGEEPLDQQRGNRVLVTCRTHFFRDHQQVKDVASGRLVGLTAAEDSALGRLARRFDAEIDELSLFDRDQIEEFLDRRLGATEADRARNFIFGRPELLALAPRPGLLDLIVKSLAKLGKGREAGVSPTDLYEVYTRQWLEDTRTPNLATPPLIRHRLLSLLAVTLWRREDRQIHYRELLAEVQRLSDHFPGLDYDRVDIELRTASFLVRSPTGHYRFSHQSFLEYFLARRLWEQLEGGTEVLDLPAVSPEVCDFFWQLPGAGARHGETVSALQAVLQGPYRPRVSENALRLAARSQKHLDTPLEVEAAHLAGAQLSGEDLQGLNLRGADLNNCRLDGAGLEGANLREAQLDGASLEKVRAARADFTHASLQGALLAGADLTQARLCKGQMELASLAGAILDGADFTAASLVGADLTAASGDSTIFEETDFSSARLEATVWWEPRLRGAIFDGAITTHWLVAAERDMPAGVVPGGLGGQEVRIGFRMGHRSWVRSATYSRTGNLLASGSDDGMVLVWDVRTGDVKWILRGAGGRVLSVAWSPDDQLLATCSSDGRVRIWTLGQGASARLLPGSTNRASFISWSPSGRDLATGTEDGSVRVWDVAKGQVWRELTGRGSRVWCVAWSPDSQELAAGTDAGVVQLLRVETGEIRLILTSQTRNQREEEGKRLYSPAIWSVAWSADGTEIAAGGEDGLVKLWETRNGSLRRYLSVSESPVWSIAWSPNSNDLASGSSDGFVRMWDTTNGHLKRAQQSGTSIMSVSWSPDGQEIAAGGDDGRVQLWDSVTGELRRVLIGSSGQIWSVAWSPDGRELAAGIDDGSAWLWNPRTGEARHLDAVPNNRIWSVAWPRQGRELATAGSDGSVRIWEAAKGEVRSVLSGSASGTLSIAWSPSRRELAGGFADGSVRIWTVATGEIRRVLSGGQHSVLSVAWSPDGREVAAGSADGSVRVWVIGSGKVRQKRVVPEGRALSVAWSKNGQLAAAGDDGLIQVWMAATGNDEREISGPRCSVWHLAWSPDGRALAAGCDDGSVQVWGAEVETPPLMLQGSGGRVLSVAWAPDGKCLAVSSDDGSVRVWDVTDGRLRGELLSLGEMSLAIVAEGWFLKSPRSGTIDWHRLRLEVAVPAPGADRAWRALPLLGSLTRHLESPQHVYWALSGRAIPPRPFPRSADGSASTS